jgi:2-phosphoglycerate kinase
MSGEPSGASRVAGRDRSRLWVEEPGGRRPFMRGILIHSLMAQGVSYEDAYRTANAVRDRIRAEGVVRREEIARLAAEELGAAAPAAGAPAPLPLPPDIRVTGQGEGMPFSKGFLSQSLLAAAIDPSDAFDVARDIERELLRRRQREIDRHALRRLAYEILKTRIGPEAGTRYLVWRHHQDRGRPFILLLGGTSGVGKTSLAHEVAHRLGVPGVLSTDSIRQVMRLMLSRELAPAIHSSSYEAHRALDGRVGGDPVLEGFRAQASTVAVGVRAMIDRAVAENASLILDGVSIVPGLLEVERWAERADVIFLVVATLDEAAFRSRFSARGKQQQERPPHQYLEHLGAILRIQEHFLELAESWHVPIVNNEVFDRSVLSIIRHVTETLRKKGGVDEAELLGG